MKLLILQLSDIHCTDRKIPQSERLDRIAPAIRTLGSFDKVSLVFTGDLSFSGKCNQIKCGKHFIGYVISSLANTFNCGFIDTIIVPGNHDIQIPSEGHSFNEISKWNKDTRITSELMLMNPFFEYAASKCCFKNNKLVDFKTLLLQDKKIQFTLLNSAPFSTLSTDDKELHYFPDSVFEEIKSHNLSEKPDYNIVIMHHSFEWFEWDTKIKLKELMFKADLVLFGHDHVSEIANISNANGQKITYCTGGEFTFREDNCSFNAIIIDTESEELRCHEFSWDEATNLYKQQTHSITRKSKMSFGPSVSYENELLRGNKQISNSMIDYYVLPELRVSFEQFTEDESLEDINEDYIISKLEGERIICITGETNSGKTSLLKYLYKYSFNKGFLSLFLESSTKVEFDFDKMLKYLVETQYDGECAYDRYCQEDHNKQIIFIDDIDRISNPKASQQLINRILESGRKIIYSSSKTNLEIETIVEKQLDEKTVGSLTIRPFFKTSRDKLIEKICKIKNASDEQIESIVIALDYLVQTQPYLFTLAPGNLIAYITFLLQDNSDVYAQKTLSMVFETNIRSQILSYARESDLPRYNSFLAFMASFMYFQKKSDIISIEELTEQVKQFNHQRKEDMNAKSFVDTCIKADILEEESNEFAFRFCNNNLLAYYVASSIKREIERDYTNTSHLQTVIQQICFGINDSIIVFLSYLTNSGRLIMKIAEQSFKHISDCKGWSIKDNNLDFLNHTTKLSNSLPSDKEKKEMKKHTVRVEEERHEAIKYRNAFDYKTEDIEKLKALRALKCVQIVGRMLVDQYSDLDTDEIDEIIESLYEIPFKVIYECLLPIQKDIHNLCDRLSEYAKEHAEKEITDDEIMQMIGNAGVSYALNILNSVAYNAATSSTIKALGGYETVSIEQDILKLMFFENTRNTVKFVDAAIEMQSKYENNLFVRKLILLIARKHIIYAYKSKPVDHVQISRLISAKILSEKGKKSLLLEKIRQKD